MTSDAAAVLAPRAESDPVPDRADRWGWPAVYAMTAAVLLSWIPQLIAPLGDNHMGRVAGRMALHIRNLHERGLVGSHLAADWQPYAPSPYAHHPPLLTMLDALFGALPGDSTFQILIGPSLVALLAIPSGAALLRGFGVRWVPTLIAVGLMIVTGYFWVFSPVTFDIGLLLALSAVVVRLRAEKNPSRNFVILSCVVALLATLGSWPCIAVAAVLGIWLFVKRRLDRVTLLVGASMVLGVAISLGYMIGVNGLDVLFGQTQTRTTGGNYTAFQFLRRQWRYAHAQLPIWYIVMLPFAVVAGLLDRRTRFYTVLATVFSAVWIIGLNDGAYIHDYWAYVVLIPGLVGMGALLDWVYARLDSRAALFGSAAAGLALVLAFAVMVFGPTRQSQMNGPSDAGRLVTEHAPAAGQKVAWFSRLPTPRWLAYYWDLAPTEITPQNLNSDRARPEDLVVMDLRRMPTFIPASIAPKAVARVGDYALFRVADLRAAMTPS
jgi:hypothetical protein